MMTGEKTVHVPNSQRAPVTLTGHGLHVKPPLSGRHSALFMHGLLTQWSSSALIHKEVRKSVRILLRRKSATMTMARRDYSSQTEMFSVVA